MHFEENQLSPGLISLSPLSTSHPSSFHPTTVPASTIFYYRFTVLMDRSPGFGSNANDSFALFRLGFPTAPQLNYLTLPLTLTPWTIKQKVRRQPEGLRPLVGIRFQVLFHSPLGVLFNFPSRYWYAIGRLRVFSLGGWSPQIQSEFLVFRPTQERNTACQHFVYGGFTLYAVASQLLPLCIQVRCYAPYNTTNIATDGLGYSAFARHYLRNLV